MLLALAFLSLPGLAVAGPYGFGSTHSTVTMGGGNTYERQNYRDGVPYRAASGIQFGAHQSLPMRPDPLIEARKQAVVRANAALHGYVQVNTLHTGRLSIHERADQLVIEREAARIAANHGVNRSELYSVRDFVNMSGMRNAEARSSRRR